MIFLFLDHPNAEPSFKFKIISFLLISINKHESWFNLQRLNSYIFRYFKPNIVLKLYAFIFFNSLKILFP